MSFDDAAVRGLFTQALSHALTLGLFENVNTHEPKSAPGNGLWCAIWVQRIRPQGSASGLSATSGVVDLMARIGASFIKQPEDGIDPNILTAASVLMKEYSGNFTLGGTVRNVDLLGQTGAALSAQAGYLQLGQRTYRVMDVSIPVIINDLWTQGA